MREWAGWRLTPAIPRVLLMVITPAVVGAEMSYGDVRGKPYSVGWTPRGLTLNGRAQLLLSGDVHYARAFPAEQDQALDKLRADSLNAVQTYAFWSLHEPEPGALCWGEADAASSPSCSAVGARANITRFLQAAAERELWVILRIGPFICGEWSYGGIPSWINEQPGVQIRAHNPSWERSMTAFVRAIWQIVEPFTAPHGGPVLMLQLENENGRAIPGDPYTEYVASLARSLNSSLPFLWCEGGQDEIVPFNAINTTGPSPFIPAINGNDGSAYAEAQSQASPEYPLFWTENEGWYHPWGSAPIDGGAGLTDENKPKPMSSAQGLAPTTRPLSVPTKPSVLDDRYPSSESGTVENPNRKPEDVAAAVAGWIARGGAFMNYYMYYGGQHFMAAAAAGVLNSYADGVNLHSDGLSNQPKRTHLAHLHATVLAHVGTIMGTPRPIPRRTLGSNGLSAFIFGDGELVFLENANGNPGADTGDSRAAVVQDGFDALPARISGQHDRSPATAMAPGDLKSNCSFPIDLSRVRYKGLVAAPSTVITEEECAAVCCASRTTAHCNMYQFYEMKTKGQVSQCWIGTATHAEGSPPPGFHSRARAKPHVDPAPGPAPSDPATVQWNGNSYTLPAYSVTVIQRSGAVLYQTHNTSKVATTQRAFHLATPHPLEWSCWCERSLIPKRSHAVEAVQSVAPMEQLNLTRDRTEYLLYVTTLQRVSRQTAKGLKFGGRIANAYSVLIDGTLVGQAWNAAHSYGSKTYEIALARNSVDGAGVFFESSGISSPTSNTTSELAILSTSLGMHSHVTSRALDFKGIVGSISLDGVALSSWRHVIGLAGEKLHAGAGNESLNWDVCPNQSGPLTWRKTSFSISPAVLNNESISVMLDVSGMSRGHMYLNGKDLGKYWTIEETGMGPTQRYYQLPRSLLHSDAEPNSRQNLLVLADELGEESVGSAANVRVVLSSMEPVWGH